MVGEAAIIGQQLRLTVLADVPIEGGPASAVRGVAAAVEAEAAALLDRQGVAGAVDRRAAQVLGEPGSAEASPSRRTTSGVLTPHHLEVSRTRPDPP